MQKFGNIWTLEDPRNEAEYAKKELKDKIVVCLSFIPNPEKAWPNNERMVTYSKYKKRKLKELGLVNEELLSHFADYDRHISIAVEFETRATAEETFRRALRPGMGIVDIYLYDKGVCVMKYD